MLPEVLARLHSTIGGLSDTELKLFAVSPTSRPSAARVVTIVTPVAKAPSALRRARGSSVGSGCTIDLLAILAFRVRRSIPWDICWPCTSLRPMSKTGRR